MKFKNKELNAKIEKYCFTRSFEKNSTVINVDDSIEYLPIVLKGSLRILLENDEGLDYFLYHILPSESCAFTISNSEKNKLSTIKAVVEEASELLLVPIQFINEWKVFPEWEDFIKEAKNQRLLELMETIELMAFGNVYKALWNYLLKRSNAIGDNILNITHQQIANELNSPRVVITRQLHQLQTNGKIILSRNNITII